MKPKRRASAGHAQVGDPSFTGGQPHQQVFGPAINPLDHRPVQPFGETVGEGEAQVRAVLTGPRKARALQHRLKAASDGFDLGEFGHGGFAGGW
jgi:hypothetical protein